MRNAYRIWSKTDDLTDRESVFPRGIHKRQELASRSLNPALSHVPTPPRRLRRPQRPRWLHDKRRRPTALRRRRRRRRRRTLARGLCSRRTPRRHGLPLRVARRRHERQQLLLRLVGVRRQRRRRPQGRRGRLPERALGRRRGQRHVRRGVRELRRRLRDVFLRGGMRPRVFAGVRLRTGVRPRVLLASSSFCARSRSIAPVIVRIDALDEFLDLSRMVATWGQPSGGTAPSSWLPWTLTRQPRAARSVRTSRR